MTAVLRRLRSGRSQSMVEFALIAPVLLLVVFGLIDLGRLIYTYVTLSQAANEGARVAVQGQAPFFVEPQNTDVEAAVKQHAIAITLGNPCPNGPIASSPSNPPPANEGYLYITQPIDIFQAGVTPSPPSSGNPNAPGGQRGTNPQGCWPAYQAMGHSSLQVTIVYNFAPLTPIIRELVTNRIVLRVYAVYRTEY